MGMDRVMKLPKWMWFVFIVLLMIIIVPCLYRKQENGINSINNIVPMERWNVMVLVDASGSLKVLDGDNLQLDINDALTFVVRRLKMVSKEWESEDIESKESESKKSGPKVQIKLGIHPFDLHTKEHAAILPFALINNDTKGTESIQIPYDDYHTGTNIEEALNYALGEMKIEQDYDELTRNIIIMFTDGKEDKLERSESLEEALKDERVLADELNCELFFISPNTGENKFEGEGDLDTIEKLSADFRFGRRYFYDSDADCELDNYIVTKDASLIMKMLELVAQIVSGKEIELIDEKLSYNISQSKTVPYYEFEVENSFDTIELFFQNLDEEDEDKIKVFRIGDEKSIDYSVERMEGNSALITLLDIQEGSYRIETTDWPRKIDEFNEGVNTELANKLLEYEKKFARKIICLRKSNFTYNVKSELIQNVDNQQVNSRLIDGREFNVPYLEKIVVVPVLDGEEVQDEKVLRSINNNFPHFYVKDSALLNLWKYCTNQVYGTDGRLRLSYDEKEKGFVGYIPVMDNREYTVKICMTRGNKTDIIEYTFDCKGKIFKTKDGQNSWRYDDGCSIHLTEQGELFTVGRKLWGRDITLDKEDATFQGKAVECNENTLTIKDTYVPYKGKYEVHGKDQFGDNWTITGTVWVLPLRKMVYCAAAFFAIVLSFWIYLAKWNCTYKIEVTEDSGKKLSSKNVDVPIGKYFTMDVLVEHALAQKGFDEKECERVGSILKENIEQLQKPVFVRKGVRRSKRRYEFPGSNANYHKEGPIEITFELNKSRL